MLSIAIIVQTPDEKKRLVDWVNQHHLDKTRHEWSRLNVFMDDMLSVLGPRRWFIKLCEYWPRYDIHLCLWAHHFPFSAIIWTVPENSASSLKKNGVGGWRQKRQGVRGHVPREILQKYVSNGAFSCNLRGGEGAAALSPPPRAYGTNGRQCTLKTVLLTQP